MCRAVVRSVYVDAYSVKFRGLACAIALLYCTLLRMERGTGLARRGGDSLHAHSARRPSAIGRFLRNLGIKNDLTITGPTGTVFSAEDNNGQSFYSEDYDSSFGHGVPAAQSAIWGLSNSLAQLPRMTGRYTDPTLGSWQEEEHPLNNVLANPSQFLTSWEFWIAFYRSLFVNGNAFAKIERSRSGFPTGLTPAVGYAPLTKAGRLYGHYLVLSYGREQRFREFVPNRNIFSMHWPAKSPVTGISLSPIQYAIITATIKSNIRAQKHVADNTPSGLNALLIDPDKIQLPAGVAKQEQALDYVRRGIKRARENDQMFTIYPGMDLKEVGSISSSDAKIIEALNLGTKFIAQAFEYPLRRLQEFTQGTKVSELSSQREDFVSVSIVPHVKSFESVATQKLLARTGSQIENGLQVIMPPDLLKMGTVKDRLTLMFGVADRGAAKRNELRRAAGLPEDPTPFGEEYLSPRGANTGTTNGENQNEEGESTQEQSDGQESTDGEEESSEGENRQPFSLIKAKERFGF